jgi:inhibitor of KinA
MLNIKRIIELGTHVILVEMDAEISPSDLHQLLKIRAVLENAYSAKKVEITNTYSCLAIHFNTDSKISLDFEKQIIQEIILSIDLSDNKYVIEPKLHIVPVCYEDEFGMDLDYLSKELQLKKQDLIEIHCKPIYTIYFLGFLPGFLYLGGLDKAIHFPRKKTPRLSIPKGSVGIGGKQTGIYPSKSPGGWQLIGNCPLELFDVHHNPPSLFKAGDQIQFKAITKTEHQEIRAQIVAGTYKHKIFNT